MSLRPIDRPATPLFPYIFAEQSKRDWEDHGGYQVKHLGTRLFATKLCICCLGVDLNGFADLQGKGRSLSYSGDHGSEVPSFDSSFLIVVSVCSSANTIRWGTVSVGECQSINFSLIPSGVPFYYYYFFHVRILSLFCYRDQNGRVIIAFPLPPFKRRVHSGNKEN